MNPPTKLLLALAFWEGDKERATKVARLIADLEPRHSEIADFLFVSRFDCSHDKPTLDHVSRKFNTYSYVNRRRGREWPHACNDLFFGTMDWLYEVNVAKRFPVYKAIVTLEPDSIPISPNWVGEISREWDRAQPAKVIGAYQTSPGPHINGASSMYSGDIQFLKKIRDVGGVSPVGGWDYIMASFFQKSGWKDSKLFRSWWQCQTMSEETFFQQLREGVNLFHGVKDESLLNHVRKRFL